MGAHRSQASGPAGEEIGGLETGLAVTTLGRPPAEGGEVVFVVWVGRKSSVGLTSLECDGL